MDKRKSFVQCWWGCELVQPLWETVQQLLKKLKIELPYDSAVPLLGIYSKKMKSLSWKGICTLVFVATLFTVEKTWNNLIGNGWMGVENMDVYSHVNTNIHKHREFEVGGVGIATHLLSWPCNKLFSAPNWHFILFNFTVHQAQELGLTQRETLFSH